MGVSTGKRLDCLCTTVEHKHRGTSFIPAEVMIKMGPTTRTRYNTMKKWIHLAIKSFRKVAKWDKLKFHLKITQADSGAVTGDLRSVFEVNV